MDLRDWAEFQESLLKSQLKIIRQFLGKSKKSVFKPRGRGKSQMHMVYDILLSAQAPLHVNEIITRARSGFGLELDRESLVSAMTKKVRSGRMFKRVAPNTFAILDTAQKNSP